MSRTFLPPVAAPVYDEDFYGDEFIRDPYPRYAAMRALGPVVWLVRHGNFAVTQYKEVREALRNHKVFSSAQGVAADQFGCDFMKGNTIASDPPFHDVMRNTMVAPLRPGTLELVQDRIEHEAETLIETLISRGTFDGMADLATHLPLAIVTELVGLPEDGRENMLRWAAGGFDIFGVQNARGRQGVETVKEMRNYIATKATPERLKPGSWTARIYELADRGEIPRETCPLLVRDYIGPSLDTTIAATGQLIYQLARNPEQYQLLCEDPSLIPNASNEAVRLGSPIRSLTRTVTDDIELGGVRLPDGARVMLVYASANRDDRKFETPDRFDVRRVGAEHLGFGNGIHMCAGMRLARLEMDSLLKALIRRVDRIEVAEPTVAMNNTICSFASLPMRLHAAGSATVRRNSERADRERRAG
ncbi:MAG: cytochrome P450 [Xanthobacteraceae bacterium]